MQSSERINTRFFGQVENLDIFYIKLPSHIFRSCDYNNNNVESMANSIRQHGLLQPLVVRTKDDNYFEIVAGLYSVFSLQIFCTGRKSLCQDGHLNYIQKLRSGDNVENIQRDSLSPLDEAKALKMYVLDKGWGSVAQLSSKIGKSPSYITKRIGLLVLPPYLYKSQ